MNINSDMLLNNLRMMMVSTIIAGLCSATSLANEDVEQSSVEIEKWHKVSDTHLAYSRGGFILPNGVIVDISFEKLLFRNGEETASSYFSTPDNQYLINDGKLNIPGLSDDLFQSIIQNDLDNQTLQTINNINIDIKNLNNINLTPSASQFYNLHSLPITIN
mgnify:CR=1 FL=1|tara:strand:+ start:183 stop:668 length:486 start_codon:yes stop_codon:yes gene_type:complete